MSVSLLIVSRYGTIETSDERLSLVKGYSFSKERMSEIETVVPDALSLPEFKRFLGLVVLLPSVVPPSTMTGLDGR